MMKVLTHPTTREELKTVLNESELAYFEALIIRKREEAKNELETEPTEYAGLQGNP